MEELRFFNTQSEHDIVQDNLEYPTVSWVKQTKKTQWMEKPDYSKRYLTFVALGSCRFTFKSSSYLTQLNYLEYSLDNGETWTRVDRGNNGFNFTTPTINKGDKILWRGSGTTLTYPYQTTSGGQPSIYYMSSQFSSTGRFNIEGNISSLLNGNNFSTVTYVNSYAYYQIFSECTSLVNAKNMVLPFKTVPSGCYAGMFSGCTSLETPPQLPATTVSYLCYNGMFYGCSSLQYAPELPATTLDERCYRVMFTNCKSLTTAPELPATTLVQNCYEEMFNGCTNLNYIKAMFTTTPSSTYTNNWVSGVAANGTFVKNSTAEWDVTGNSGIPSGWTIKTANE